MRAIQWGMIGYILIAVLFTEHFCEAGRVSWGLGYWVIVGAALWGVSGGLRMRRRFALRIKEATDKTLPEREVRRRLNARNAISMATALSVAIWGLVIRYVLHGTLWQAVPFYVLGLALLLIWGPKTTTAMHSD